MYFMWPRLRMEFFKKNKTVELRKPDNVLIDQSQKNVITSEIFPVLEILKSNEFVKNQLPKNLDTDLQLLQPEIELGDEFDEPRYEVRLQSWQESIRTGEFTTKNYELTPEALNLFKQLGLDSKAFSMLYGNQIQHAIHQEFVDIVNNAGLIYLKTKNEESRELAKEIIICSDAGSSYLKAGFILKATYTANFCWALLDCGIAMSEGAVQGLKNTGELLTHPIEAATKLSHAIYNAGYYLGKILTTLVNDGIIAIKNPEEAATRIEQRVEKINTIIQAIEDKLKTKQPRDIVKKSTELVVESWCTGKILSFLAKFLKDSNNKFSEIIKKLGPAEEAVAITAEGLPVQVRIAEEGIEQLFSLKDVPWKIESNLAKNISWTNHGFKHFPPKNLSWKEIVKLTKTGDALYKPGINIEKIERFAWENGKKVTTDKPWKVIEFDHIIGAKNGTETQFMRVEISANTIHGHPITPAEFKKYLS